MTKISPAGNSLRISLGKRATRTVTEPNLSSRQHNAESTTQATESLPLNNRYASQDNGGWPFSSSGYSSPRLKAGSSTCLRDIKEVFTIQQIMRDTLETRLKPRSTNNKVLQQRNHHKREFLRSWSRERIIVTEEIIYPTSNLTITSASGSFSSIVTPQSKPYYPLEKYGTLSSGKSLPAPSVTMIGALPSRVAEYGRKVPLSTTGFSKMSLARDRRIDLHRQASEPEGSTLLFSDLSSVGISPGARVIKVEKGPQSLRLQRRMHSRLNLEPHQIASIQCFNCTAVYHLMEHATMDQLL